MSPNPRSDAAARASSMASFNRARSIVVNYPTERLESLGLDFRVINWAREALNHWVRWCSVFSFSFPLTSSTGKISEFLHSCWS